MSLKKTNLGNKIRDTTCEHYNLLRKNQVPYFEYHIVLEKNKSLTSKLDHRKKIFES